MPVGEHGLAYRETVKVALVHLDATDQSERVVDAIRATAADTEDDIREMPTRSAQAIPARLLLDEGQQREAVEYRARIRASFRYHPEVGTVVRGKMA